MANTFYLLLRIVVIALGILAVAASVLLIWKALKGRKTKKRLGLNISATAVAALCLAIIYAVSYVTGMYTSSINAAMTVSGASEADVDVDGWKELAYTIADEGMVLMKNDNNVLPLKTGAKVNLLGYVAYNPIYSGGGSGSVSATDAISIVSSLKDAGIEINPAIEASGIYLPKEVDSGSNLGFSVASFTVNELPVDTYTGDVSMDHLKAYSDTAIIVLGRTGSEGSDLTADYLQLSGEERALLESASKAFDKVIVVINGVNAIEMDWVNEYDIDAILWAGITGPYGFKALGRILTGEVNPSGKLPDTWVYDNDSNPSNENFGEQQATNVEGKEVLNTFMGTTSIAYRYYVDYVEGIYVGYKWYETAYAEQAVITNTKTGETFDYSDYDSIVAYPFGYGLSYTTFSQKITGGTLTDGTALRADGTYTLEVTVTNTGNTAGKEVVQVYVTAPYTDYDKQNRVEKAAVSLAVYGKTSVLQPGTSEKVTLEINMEEIASYDSSHSNGDGTNGSYMLDAGDYIFSVRSNAHTALDQVTANLSSQYFFSGDNKRSSDKTVAVNQFDEAARGEYLSRQNGFANYASAMNSVTPGIESSDYAYIDNFYDEALDSVVSKHYVEGVDYAAKGTLTMADMAGLDYDDPKWEQLLSQLTLSDMFAITGNTAFTSVAAASVGKPTTSETDGPMGLSSMLGLDFVAVAYPSLPLLAATFNTELAHELGSCIADQAQINSVTGWYAPAMNTHRSALSGRNFEYYSEDATLGAGMAAAETAGAQEKGLITYIKHFALNDQESRRDSVHTYSNEQAIREIYLKPFEYAVKDGGATGVMNSMNYIGDVYAGGHVGLLTNVLRGEWGFRGTVLSDMDQAAEYRSFWAALRAGVDAWLGFSQNESTVSSDADIYYLMRGCHNVLYSQANANVFEAQILNWQGYRTMLYIELGLLAAACVAAIIIRNFIPQKKEQEHQ